MSSSLVTKRFLKLLDEFAKVLPEGTDLPALRAFSPPEASKFCKVAYKVAGVLLELATELDTIRPPSGLIELFAPATIGRLIGEELRRIESHYVKLYQQDPIKWRNLFSAKWIHERFGS